MYVLRARIKLIASFEAQLSAKHTATMNIAHIHREKFSLFLVIKLFELFYLFKFVKTVFKLEISTE